MVYGTIRHLQRLIFLKSLIQRGSKGTRFLSVRYLSKKTEKLLADFAQMGKPLPTLWFNDYWWNGSNLKTKTMRPEANQISDDAKKET